MLSHLDAWDRICRRGGGRSGGKRDGGKRGGGKGVSGLGEAGGGSREAGVASDSAPALVFEDDIKLHPRFKQRLVEYLRAVPAGWELLHLVHAPRLPGWYHNRTHPGSGSGSGNGSGNGSGSGKPVGGTGISISPGGAAAVRSAEYESMTLAYAVTAAGACKLVDGFDRLNVIASDEYLPALSAPHMRQVRARERGRPRQGGCQAGDRARGLPAAARRRQEGQEAPAPAAS